ncbi:hypothetical protein [uncultured Polaribacter sp.]|uniref:hypothetical protein n=1 Tax=uncultured Polaribacter sp. TaxID=174711 RepID=UPI00261145FD|nr:hypothetical protein [uncultured Polaribacter sp.]
MKKNNFKYLFLILPLFFSCFTTNCQVENFNKNAWSFEPTSGITYISNPTSHPKKPGPGNIVEAFTQINKNNSKSKESFFYQSSEQSYTGKQSLLADFNELKATPKLQSFRPNKKNKNIGNFDIKSTGTYKASIWVYMTTLKKGKIRFNLGKGGYKNVNFDFDFDLSTVTKVNT